MPQPLRSPRRAGGAGLLALAGLVAFAAPARAQDSVVANPPALGTMALVRVQFTAGSALDTNRWYQGELVTTTDGCSYLNFPDVALVNGLPAAVPPGGPSGARRNISFGHFRAVQTRARPTDPWRVVDPTWIHSRALGC